jgi:hypothetical protein
MSGSCRMINRPRPLLSYCALRLGHTATASPVVVCSLITATAMLTVQNINEKLAQLLASRPSAPSPLGPVPTLRRSASSRSSARNGPMRSRSRTPRYGTSGCCLTVQSITGSGKTQHSEADPLSSGPSSCTADQSGYKQQPVFSPCLIGHDTYNS